MAYSSTYDSDENFDYLFKIVLIGDAGVGKTCVVQRFKTGVFTERHGSTIGVDFTMKTLVLDGKRVKLQVWDTAGQERFRTITQSYYRSANGVIIAYDITKRDTFNNIERWLADVSRYAGTNIEKVLIGNKSDLANLREVDPEEAYYLAEQHGMLATMETSAKDATNIEDAFVSLARVLKENYAKVALEEHAQGIVITSGSNVSSIDRRLTNCCR
ncbi:PREDICTED: ras-related protein Rab-43-like isoform X2 [Priapulus caudatus]|uniref:Ras-related protein Rab-43-like isoform X1 n=1 Tax=Priapulus caudatus TaxID=37621 RepID=A0ABM1DU20_PRICU|nr:PREDICTED: ras-related protein Rab-43-like isoform X1 [Priapulus caudatus]XP_014663442.1 PREDICTED: ras-related protein Rab-43-like isoform X2 [Priapulus caudatus]